MAGHLTLHCRRDVLCKRSEHTKARGVQSLSITLTPISLRLAVTIRCLRIECQLQLRVEWSICSLMRCARIGQVVAVWDLRRTDQGAAPLVRLEGHTDEVIWLLLFPRVKSWCVVIVVMQVSCVEWSTQHEDVLASGSLDCRVNLWDLSEVPHASVLAYAALVTLDYAGQKSPLVFSHAGHRGGISDLAWNLHDPWTIASVGEVWLNSRLVSLDVATDCMFHRMLPFKFGDHGSIFSSQRNKHKCHSQLSAHNISQPAVCNSSLNPSPMSRRFHANRHAAAYQSCCGC